MPTTTYCHQGAAAEGYIDWVVHLPLCSPMRPAKQAIASL